MKYNYSKLLGRMKELGYTQAKLAKEIGISKATLNAKLNNWFPFTTDEIIAICKVLKIPTKEITKFFYDVSSEN